jgi:hypothetical protein
MIVPIAQPFLDHPPLRRRRGIGAGRTLFAAKPCDRHANTASCPAGVPRTGRVRSRSDVRRVHPTAYQKSLGEITAKLNVDDRRRFEIALLTLALGNLAQSNVLQSASHDALNNLATLATVADPLRYLDRVRPAIGGRSASEVIRRVASDLDSEISRNDARSAAEYELLTAVAIDHPRYYWDRRRNLPTIEYFRFTVRARAYSPASM